MRYLNADVAEIMSNYNNKAHDVILSDTNENFILSGIINDITTEICISALTGGYSVAVNRMDTEKLPSNVFYAITNWFKKLGYNIISESDCVDIGDVYYCYCWRVSWRKEQLCF